MKILSTKINIVTIFKGHIKTLINANDKKVEFGDIITMYIFPAFVAWLLKFLNVHLTDSSISIVVASLAIIVGLLLNVLILIFDILNKSKDEPRKVKLVEELVFNISYSITISILSIILTFTTYIKNYWIFIFSTWAVYFLILNFLFTFFMILKRVHNLFIYEINKKEPKKETAQSAKRV